MGLLEAFGAVCWQPTGLMEVAGLWGCMLAGANLRMSLGSVCWQPTALWRQQCWQPTGLVGCLRPLGLYVGNLQSWMPSQCGLRQPTGLMGLT